MTNKYSDKYYAYILKDNIENWRLKKKTFHDDLLKSLSTQEKIIFDIIHDFTDRRGLRQGWEQIDDDIQEEIIEKWIEIVTQHLNDKE